MHREKTLADHVFAFLFTVAQESAKATTVELVDDRQQESIVELDASRELLSHLPNAVDELQEDGRPLRIVVFALAMADSLKFSYFFLSNHSDSLKSKRAKGAFRN